MCAEALLKFAEGACIRGIGGAIPAAVGRSQYGAGRPGGAEAEGEEVRAAALAFPDDPLVTTDVANAFGSVEWADALEALTSKLPALAVLFATEVQLGHALLYTQLNEHMWHCFAIYGSLVQGNPSSHIIFCVVIGVVHAEFTNSAN